MSEPGTLGAICPAVGGLGPVFWLMISEVFPLRVRSTTAITREGTSGSTGASAR